MLNAALADATVKSTMAPTEPCKQGATRDQGLQGPQQRQWSYPHDLALLLQHLECHQLLHVVLSCAVIQHLLGAINETP